MYFRGFVHSCLVSMTGSVKHYFFGHSSLLGANETNFLFSGKIQYLDNTIDFGCTVLACILTCVWSWKL